MKKVLFIDRDGTLIQETKDEKINDISKLTFYPKSIVNMYKIAQKLDFELVMVTNQDGLGTAIFPEEPFWEVQNFIIKTFANEGVIFSNIFIDKSYPHENLPTRKPGTAMLTTYMNNPHYNLKDSFVIGDRLTDVELAKNLGAKAIFINDNSHLGAKEVSISQDEIRNTVALETTDWSEIYHYLKNVSS